MRARVVSASLAQWIALGFVITAARRNSGLRGTGSFGARLSARDSPGFRGSGQEADRLQTAKGSSTMRTINSFRDMYLAELQELLSVEIQLADALLRMAGAATHPSLKRALIHHRAETETEALRVMNILKMHGADETVHIDQAMQALIAETMKMMMLLRGDDLRDAALIASAQKIEHYEIAAYGTAAALAGQLNLRDEQNLLHMSLEEEREFDALLTTLAKGEINRDALAA
jgi:ferritin-like metal-binding protein YciE